MLKGWTQLENLPTPLVLSGFIHFLRQLVDLLRAGWFQMTSFPCTMVGVESWLGLSFHKASHLLQQQTNLLYMMGKVFQEVQSRRCKALDLALEVSHTLSLHHIILVQKVTRPAHIQMMGKFILLLGRNGKSHCKEKWTQRNVIY